MRGLAAEMSHSGEAVQLLNRRTGRHSVNA